jgi:hypothetical protein
MVWRADCSWWLSISAALVVADVPLPHRSMALAVVSVWLTDWVTPLIEAAV